VAKWRSEDAGLKAGATQNGAAKTTHGAEGEAHAYVSCAAEDRVAEDVLIVLVGKIFHAREGGGGAVDTEAGRQIAGEGLAA
jgi:hypothetical protein